MPSIPRPHVLQDVRVRTKACVDKSVDAEDRRASLGGSDIKRGSLKRGILGPKEAGADDRPEC